jgi:arylsulfatase A
MAEPTRRQFLRTAAATTGAALLSRRLGAAEAARGRKPNIIFILADDLGIDALGSYGGDRFKTPVLDALAAGGIRFDYVYCTPVCGPTRAQLLTGQYPFRNGAIDIDATMRAATPENCPSLPAVLKGAGYATGMTGKWRQVKLEPNQWGFDESLRSPTANGYYQARKWFVDGREVTVEKERYFPDVMSDFALDFIRRHKHHPFFLYYALTNPHTPIVPTPDSKPGVTDRKELYADNIAYIDKLVGRVVDLIKELGLTDDTLICFSGDNGTLRNFQGTVNGRRLTGGKVRMSEGGAQVPLVARWPGAIKPGSVCADLVDFTDLLPTFAEIGGAKLPDDKGKIDGRSFLPRLRGREGDSRDWVFVQMGQYYYVRSRNWRLDELGRLYDMRQAPFAEKLIPPDAADPEAAAARKRLEKVLHDLDPRSGRTWDRWRGFGNRGPGKKRPD